MILGERFYQMSNAIFHYDLTPTEFMVYSYLVSCACQKDMCWPSMHRIALNCNCSENTVRKAIASLVKKRFIRKVTMYEDWEDHRVPVTSAVRPCVTTCAIPSPKMGRGHVRQAPPDLKPFSTPEGRKNEKQDKQPTSQPASVASHLPAVRAVSRERK